MPGPAPFHPVSSLSFPASRERHGIRYTLLEALRPDRARFAFISPFAGVDTLWNATLLSLDRHWPPLATALTPYIDIGDNTPAGRNLIIALRIPVVDEPAILRTIIMVRQYKRLRAGRHEFGKATAH